MKLNIGLKVNKFHCNSYNSKYKSGHNPNNSLVKIICNSNNSTVEPANNSDNPLGGCRFGWYALIHLLGIAYNLRGSF